MNFQAEIVLTNNTISAFSGFKQFHFSSYRSLAPENTLSDGTDVGGAA